MAITPEDADRLTLEDEEIVGRLEREIDDKIRRSYPSSSGGTLYLDIAFPEEKIRRALTVRYEAAGWHVEWKSDQRDSSFLMLSPSSFRACR